MTDETQRGVTDEASPKPGQGGEDGTPDSPGESEDDRFAVRITVDRESARRLTARTDLDFGDRPHIRPQAENRAILEAFATKAQIADLQGEGYTVAVGENETAAGRARQADIGQGDRFEGGRITPRGIGRKVGGMKGGSEPSGQEPSGGGPRAAS